MPKALIWEISNLYGEKNDPVLKTQGYRKQLEYSGPANVALLYYQYFNLPLSISNSSQLSSLSSGINTHRLLCSFDYFEAIHITKTLDKFICFSLKNVLYDTDLSHELTDEKET